MRQAFAPEPKVLSENALIRLIRDTVPCPASADPLVRDAYENALRDWAKKAPWERDVAGFECFLSSALSTMIY